MDPITGYSLTGQLREAVAKGCGVLEDHLIDWRKNPGALSLEDLQAAKSEILLVLDCAIVKAASAMLVNS